MNARELVEGWLEEGRAHADDEVLTLTPRPTPDVVSKLRRAYDWIASEAILTPYHDIEYGAPLSLGRGEQRVALRQGRGYSSFILLPLLTLMVSRRLLIIGAPGRGKSTMAVLMAMLCGASRDEVRRQVQRGHPQLTIGDLLGSPLPGDLVRAEDTDQVHVRWRRWIQSRVKIIDEYNRIPTKTQSALLSLMSEGYAEQFEQTIEAGRSAWFLTANDDLGGGTFPVIEALKDRIDLVVRCTPFHARHLDALERRIRDQRAADDFIPADLILDAEELDAIDRRVRAVRLPEDVRELLGFFAGQLDFCRRASNRLEYMNKDTLHLAGRRLGHVCTEDCPLDKQENLCTQTESGISARAFLTLLHYSRAIACFRGHDEVEVEDIMHILPWALHEKLQPNLHSAFFQGLENQVYLTDRVSWIQQLFERAIQQHAAYQETRDQVIELKERLDEDLQRVPSRDEIESRLEQLRAEMERVMQKYELNGPVHEDLLLLKGLHTRYQGMLADGEEGRS